MDKILCSKSKQQQIDAILCNYEGERKQQHQEETKDELVKIRQRVDLMMEVYDNELENRTESSQIEFFNSLEEVQRIFENKQVKSNYLNQFRVFVVGLQSGFEKKHAILHSLCDSLSQLQDRFALDTIDSSHSEASLNQYSIDGALSTLHRSIQRLDGIKSAMRKVFKIQNTNVETEISSENVQESLDMAEEEMKSISSSLNKMRKLVAVSNNKIQSLHSRVEKTDQENRILKSLLRQLQDIPSVSNHLDENTSQSIKEMIMSSEQDSQYLTTSKSRIIYSPTNSIPHDTQHTTAPTSNKQTSAHKQISDLNINSVKSSNESKVQQESEIPELRKQIFRRQYAQKIDTRIVSDQRSLSPSSNNHIEPLLSDICIPLPEAPGSDSEIEGNIQKVLVNPTQQNTTTATIMETLHSLVQTYNSRNLVSSTNRSRSNHNINQFDNVTLQQQTHTTSLRNSPISIKHPDVLHSPPSMSCDKINSFLDSNTSDLPAIISSNCMDSVCLALREQLQALQQLRIQEARDFKRRIYSMQMELNNFRIHKPQTILNQFASSHQSGSEYNTESSYVDNKFIQPNLATNRGGNPSIEISEILSLISEIHNVFIDVVTQSSKDDTDSLQTLKFSSVNMNISNVWLNLKRSLAHLTGLVDTEVTINGAVDSVHNVIHDTYLKLFDASFSEQSNIRLREVFLQIEDSFQKFAHRESLEQPSEVSLFTQLDIANNCKTLDNCDIARSITSSKKLFIVALSNFYTNLTFLRWSIFKRFLTKYSNLSLAIRCDDQELKEIIKQEMSRFKISEQRILHQILMRRVFIAKRLTEELILLEKSTGKYFIKPIYTLPNHKPTPPLVLAISSLSSNTSKGVPKIFNKYEYHSTDLCTQPKSMMRQELSLHSAHISCPITAATWKPKLAYLPDN
ncbi:hypothetical protein LOD99_12385 [Oopsacas minuta]|uniref:Uncharacterized protein n=1 Tax=Oopsacas minuta TaxID=111878 RepID=A0AAV7JG16_9METZ|nr:hypothetical protein LOD99_12385 [Oopsacas minuta]